MRSRERHKADASEQLRRARRGLQAPSIVGGPHVARATRFLNDLSNPTGLGHSDRNLLGEVLCELAVLPIGGKMTAASGKRLAQQEGPSPPTLCQPHPSVIATGLRSFTGTRRHIVPARCLALRGPKPTLRAVGGTQVYAFGGIDGGNVFARSLAPTSSKPPQEPILRGLSDGLLPLVAGTLQIWTVGFTGAIARRYRHEHLVTALRLPRYEHARAFTSQAVNVVASLVAFAAVCQCHRSLKRGWLRNHRVRLHLALDIRERVGRRKHYGDGDKQSDSCAVHS